MFVSLLITDQPYSSLCHCSPPRSPFTPRSSIPTLHFHCDFAWFISCLVFFIIVYLHLFIFLYLCFSFLYPSIFFSIYCSLISTYSLIKILSPPSLHYIFIVISLDSSQWAFCASFFLYFFNTLFLISFLFIFIFLFILISPFSLPSLLFRPLHSNSLSFHLQHS